MMIYLRKMAKQGGTRPNQLNLIKSFGFILLGSALSTYGLKGFILNSHLIDGGVSGISLLISRLSGIPLSALIVLLNLPFVLLGARDYGKQFAVKSSTAIALLAAGVYFFEFDLLTQDLWLISVFGGFFTGAGVGLVIRGGGILDGTELLSVYISKHTKFSISDIGLLLNVAIFVVAGYFLSIEVAMYSILTYLSGAKTADYLSEGVDEYIGVTIVSEKHEEIRKMIADKIGRGATLYHGTMGHGKRGHADHETKIVFTVITRLELSKIKQEIDNIDKSAFIAMNSVIDTRGGMTKKRSLE